MTNQEIIFASLVGSGIVKLAPRLAIVENEMEKHVLPSMNPTLVIPNGQKVLPTIFSEFPLPNTLNTADAPIDKDKQFFPLGFSVDNDKTRFYLPYEPMVNISGKNNIVKRSVAKWHTEYSKDLKGTIKERWSQDDYEISVTGFLMGSILRGTAADCFPRADFENLRQVFTNAKEVLVFCEPLSLLGITKVVIEDFQFPFTKGENVQAYTFKMVSDDNYHLLIEENA